MGITIGKSPSYFWLNSWVLANIIELATQTFCDRFVDFKLDPGRRLYDQMTQAVRSIRANIAEGSGRHDTSIETEMRLTDVARGSAHELLGDYINFMMRMGIPAWQTADPRYQEVICFRLQQATYGPDIIPDVMRHILTQKSRLDKYLDSPDPYLAANCLVVLCIKINSMLTRMLETQLSEFRHKGGFTENMTIERLEARRAESHLAGAPNCPRCGKPMLRRTIRKGARQGEEFWGCSDYPSCVATLPITTTSPQS